MTAAGDWLGVGCVPHHRNNFKTILSAHAVQKFNCSAAWHRTESHQAQGTCKSQLDLCTTADKNTPALNSAYLQSGDVDEEALRAVLLSLDLSEYIPSTIVSSSGLDLDDALVRFPTPASKTSDCPSAWSLRASSKLLGMWSPESCRPCARLLLFRLL